MLDASVSDLTTGSSMVEVLPIRTRRSAGDRASTRARPIHGSIEREPDPFLLDRLRRTYDRRVELAQRAIVII